eukprot:scaffold87003_cov15-Tisochrysis_lutea.AAC.1
MRLCQVRAPELHLEPGTEVAGRKLQEKSCCARQSIARTVNSCVQILFMPVLRTLTAAPTAAAQASAPWLAS